VENQKHVNIKIDVSEKQTEIEKIKHTNQIPSIKKEEPVRNKSCRTIPRIILIKTS
jgi:hypothetical protein